MNILEAIEKAAGDYVSQGNKTLEGMEIYMKQTSSGNTTVTAKVVHEIRNNVLHDFLVFYDRENREMGRIYYGSIINQRWDTNKEKG